MAKRVGIGEYAIGGPQDAYRATLGSCIGVAMLWPNARRFALAHILLPHRDKVGQSAPPTRGVEGHETRYADTAVPFLLEKLGAVGRRREVIAYVAGGGIMYDAAGNGDPVGRLNERVTLASLAEHRIRVVAQDVGGDEPRQLVVSGPQRSVCSMHLSTAGTGVEWPFPPHFGTGETSDG